MKPLPVPTFTSDRMALLGPLVTPAALALARRRLINHKERLSDSESDISTVIVALILVREMNPGAHYTNEEEGILRGLSADTYGARRTAGEFRM
jgi:hypothetical protein